MGSPSFYLENGLDVVTGQIDRIDMSRRDDRTYVVVIDYKSGRKQLDDWVRFLWVWSQLLTYMFVALLNIGDGAVPAAVLYCYVRNDKVSLSYRIDEADKKKEYDAKGKLTVGFI